MYHTGAEAKKQSPTQDYQLCTTPGVSKKSVSVRGVNHAKV
jgi:hypothetical protein